MGLFGRRDLIHIPTARCYLRLPERRDHLDWARLRRESAEFLRIWEPVWAKDHFSKQSFKNRVYWARRVFAEESAIPLFIFRQTDDALLGGITLDNIRRGPSQSATLGYWIGQGYARQGYMSEAIMALVAYILLGSIALKRGKTKAIRATAYAAALGCLGYIVAVAISKSATLGMI